MTNTMQLPPEVAGFEARHRISHVALSAFDRICRDWQCTDEESVKLIGGIGLIELLQIQGKADRREPFEMTDEQLYRIKCLVEIYRGLANTHPSLNRMRRELRRSWPRLPFLGKSPMHHMTTQADRGILQAAWAILGAAPERPAPALGKPPAKRVAPTREQEPA